VILANLTLEMFRSWLSARPEDEVISENWNWHSCPLCKFISNVTGSNDVVVSRENWGFYHADKQLPAWAREVVYWVDKIRPRIVTAGELAYITGDTLFKPERWKTSA
jgi:hypothetical protein